MDISKITESYPQSFLGSRNTTARIQKGLLIVIPPENYGFDLGEVEGIYKFGVAAGIKGKIHQLL